MEEAKTDKLPEPKTNWKRVYLLVLGWLVLFTLFMLAFTKFTS